MADPPGRGRLLGSRSSPFFRRLERTRCRSLLFFLPVFTRPRAPRHASRTLLTPVETVSPPISVEVARIIAWLARRAPGTVRLTCSPWSRRRARRRGWSTRSSSWASSKSWPSGFLLVAAVYHWDEFDEPLDGVVYGVALALGFATLENLLFSRGWAWVSPGRGRCSPCQRTRSSAPPWATTRAAPSSIAARGSGVIARSASRRPPSSTGSTLPRAPRFHGLHASTGSTLPRAPRFHGLHASTGSTTTRFIMSQRAGRGAVSALSVLLWVFVLRRVHRALRVSPFRPPLMPPRAS
jgi:PrsW family intramembrane metalloprotease